MNMHVCKAPQSFKMRMTSSHLFQSERVYESLSGLFYFYLMHGIVITYRLDRVCIEYKSPS